MISFLVFIFILGVLIIVHEFGHFAAAKKLKVKVEKFSLGFGPEVLSKKKNETQYSLSAIPLGGYVKMAGDNLEEYKGSPDEYLSRPPCQRAAIVFCGPFVNYSLGVLCFWFIFFAGYPTLTTKVGGLIDGLGAKEAGIEAGDRIIAVDDKKVEVWEELQEVIQSKKNTKQVKISLLRNNELLNLEVSIKQKSLDDLLGQKRSVGLIGITPQDETIKIRHGFLKSFILGVNKAWDLTVLTYKALWRMIWGKLSFRQSMTGPLGIFYITSQATHLGVLAVLQLVAVLNISLAIFNLLPLPVLDGGHILLLLVEKARGKALSLKTEQVVTRLGLSVIICLAIFVTYNDILRFFGDKIAKVFTR